MRGTVRNAIAVGAAVAVLALVAGGATARTNTGGGSRQPETLVFDMGESRLKIVDLGTEGEGIGDQWHIRATLLENGEVAATVRVVCHRASAVRIACLTETTFGDRGTIVSEGYEDLRAPVSVEAVTGGTGEFMGVRGQSTLDFAAGTVTFELV